MKPFAVTLLIVIVYFAFVGRVSAQCIDYASCVGERAEIDARLRPWARETADAKAEERRAVATQRAYDRAIALTATEAARPTRTPVPTVTAQPSATVQATSTPQPTAQSSATVLPTVVVVKPTTQPQPPQLARDWASNILALVLIVSLSMAAIAFGFLWNWHSKRQINER